MAVRRHKTTRAQYTVLAAPNSFKECASSVHVADRIRQAFEGCTDIAVRRLPVSDGGDGFVAVCHAAFDMEYVRYSVPRLRADGCRQTKAAYDRAGRMLILETADIIGLKDVPPPERDPLRYSSEPLGRLLRRVAARPEPRVRSLLIGLGGTATNDLGLGLAVPFGLRLFDCRGAELPVIPRNYVRACRIELPRRINMPIEAVVDVDAPLLGRKGPSRMFAPQKGAGRRDVELMERGTAGILALLKRQHGIDLKKHSWGAAGGLCVGLSLIAELTVVRSTEFVLHRLGARDAIAHADVLITGEGRFDRQSLMNKATGILVREAARQSVPVVVIAGSMAHGFRTRLPKGSAVAELQSLFQSREESIARFNGGLNGALRALRAYIKGGGPVRDQGRRPHAVVDLLAGDF